MTRETITNRIQQISDDLWMWMAYVADRMEEEKYRNVPLLSDAEMVSLSDADFYLDDTIGDTDSNIPDFDHQHFCDDWFYETLYIDNC